MVERSDRMWFTGEGNGKPLQYACLENPMNSMLFVSSNLFFLIQLVFISLGLGLDRATSPFIPLISREIPYCVTSI